MGKKSSSVFFLPKLSLSLTCFGPSAVLVGSVKSGALVPTVNGMIVPPKTVRFGWALSVMETHGEDQKIHAARRSPRCGIWGAAKFLRSFFSVLFYRRHEGMLRRWVACFLNGTLLVVFDDCSVRCRRDRLDYTDHSEHDHYSLRSDYSSSHAGAGEEYRLETHWGSRVLNAPLLRVSRSRQLLRRKI